RPGLGNAGGLPGQPGCCRLHPVRDLGLCPAGLPLRAQSKLLALRRLPRHRRRRARQAQRPGERRDQATLEGSQPAQLHGRGQPCRAGGRRPDHCHQRVAVRIHAQRPAPGRWGGRGRICRTYRARPGLHCPCAGSGAAARMARWRDPAIAHHRPGPTLPQRRDRQFHVLKCPASSTEIDTFPHKPAYTWLPGRADMPMQPGQDHPGSPPHTGHHLAPALPWPARSAQLLEASFQLCTERLRDPLRASVNQFAQQLFDRADRAHNPFEQQRLMNCREQMAQQLNPLVLRCFDEIRQHFERLGLPPASAPEATGNSWHELTLVDPAEQELATTLDQIGSRGESQQLEALHDLGYRLGVLVAAPPLEGETLPVSPQVLIRAFHAATLPLQLPLDDQVQLLRSADRNLIRALAPIYAAVNAALREAGILRQLRSVPFLRHAATRPQLPAAAATEPQAAPGLPEPGPQAPPMAHASAPIEVLESLRDLLAQRRAAELRGAGGPANVATHAASTEELQGALGALQQHLAQVTDRASRELRSAARLHEELVTQLNAGKSADAPRTQLTSEQGDTVELVATLFEQLANQLHRGGTAKSLLGGLQLPVLRMAVADQGFFEHHSHPARQLLDTVATAADEWLDGTDDDANRLLASKLEQLVTRASDEPPSSSLYAVLLADIEQQVAQLKRKAEAAERRHV